MKSTRFLIGGYGYGLAILILLFYTGVLVLQLLALAANRDPGVLPFWIALTGTAAAPWIRGGRRRAGGRNPLGLAALFLVAVAGSLTAARLLYDTSWDGQTYHLEAILRLAGGWNPLHETMPTSAHHWLFIEHYPKSAWLTAAAFLRATDSMEAAKAPALLLVSASGGLALRALLYRRALRTSLAVVLALLAAANPVSLCQAFSFCVDGQLSSLLVGLAFLLLIAPRGGAWRLAVGLCAVLAATLKFTGLVYALPMAGVALLYAYRRDGPAAHGPTLAAAVAIVLGVVALGAHPYITNTIRHGHPFHPLMGRRHFDIMQNQYPAGFRAMSPLWRFAHSFFGVSDNPIAPAPARLKVPGTITSLREVTVFGTADTRVAGWGPFFSAAALLGWVAWGGARPPRAAPPEKVALLVAATVLLCPEAWWARFAPQLWLLPVLLAAGLLERKPSPGRWMGRAVIGLLVLNQLAVGAGHGGSAFVYNRQIRKTLDHLRAAPLRPSFCLGVFQSTRRRLAEAGITVNEVETAAQLPPGRVETFPATQALFVLPDSR